MVVGVIICSIILYMAIQEELYFDFNFSRVKLLLFDNSVKYTDVKEGHEPS